MKNMHSSFCFYKILDFVEKSFKYICFIFKQAAKTHISLPLPFPPPLSPSLFFFSTPLPPPRPLPPIFHCPTITHSWSSVNPLCKKKMPLLLSFLETNCQKSYLSIILPFPFPISLPLFYFSLALTPLPYPTFHYPTIMQTCSSPNSMCQKSTHLLHSFFKQAVKNLTSLPPPSPLSISLSSIYLLPPPPPQFPPPLSTNHLSHRPAAPWIRCARSLQAGSSRPAHSEHAAGWRHGDSRGCAAWPATGSRSGWPAWGCPAPSKTWSAPGCLSSPAEATCSVM